MRRRARCTGLLVLGAAIVTTIFSPAGAADPQPGTGGEISLASQTAWVPVGGTFELMLDVGGIDEASAFEVAVTVHDAVTSRSQFRQTLEGELLGRELRRQPPTPLAGQAIDDSGDGVVRVALSLRAGVGDTGPAPLALPRAGVYPVGVELVDAGTGTVVDGFTTHLVRGRDDDAEPLAVAWLQPFAAEPALRPDGTVELDAGARQDLVTTAGALRASDVPLTVVPRPETLDALRTVDPEIVADLTGGLERRGVVAGTYVEVDVAALAAAGLDEELAAQRSRGAQVVETTLEVPVERRTWISDDPLDPVALRALTGIERLVVPEVALAPLDRPLTLANPFLVTGAGGSRIETAAADAGLASHFRAGGDQVLAAHHLLADLAVLAYDAPGLSRGVVVRPPPGWDPSPEFLTTSLAALGAEGTRVVRPVTLDELFDQVPPASATGTDLVRALRPPTDRPPALPTVAVHRARDEVASFAAMAGPASPAVELLERLVLVAAAEALSEPERRAYLDGARRSVAERLAQLQILGGSFRLTSREAVIPLTVVNGLDVEMQASLLLESDKLVVVGAGPVGTGSATIPLTLPPGNTPVMVPVEARASGDFPLRVTLRSPDGRLEAATVRLTVRSTFLSGVGIGLSAGAGLFLCVWWARNWRTARRDRRLVPSP
ncbi:MAG: DUF6049 family protein [Acidimicrobiales bacterium]